jgi:DNA-directed RNA polymerase specialized sigma24 family protein
MKVDPFELDRYTKKDINRSRKRPLDVVKNLDRMKRAMQKIPPRELQMLFHLTVLRVDQDELAEVFNVRQSNISYRVIRAQKRIRLHEEISSICSETTLRTVLIDAGLSDSTITTVLGVVKTSSQSAAADALGVTQGSVRHLYSTAVKKLKDLKEKGSEIVDLSEALELLVFIEKNYNQLRSIKTQGRWDWKVGDSNYATGN